MCIKRLSSREIQFGRKLPKQENRQKCFAEEFGLDVPYQEHRLQKYSLFPLMWIEKPPEPNNLFYWAHFYALRLKNDGILLQWKVLTYNKYMFIMFFG